jgi:hypothetical protein
METASVIRKFRPAAKPLAGRKGSTAKPAKKRTAGAHRNGFLNHAFQPFWGVAFPDWKAAEKEFFVSVKNLCALYGWTVPDVSGLSFPDNVREAYNGITAQQLKGSDLEIKICQDEQHTCCLATAKVFDTGYHLYYIPVRPLWKMRENPEEVKLYRMVRALFAYFYAEQGVVYQPAAIGLCGVVHPTAGSTPVLC